MSWVNTKIGEHCTVTSSKRFHLSDRSESGIPFYCSKEIIQKVKGQEITDCDYIKEEAYEEVKKRFGVPEKGDLLITTRGTYGVPYIYKESDKFYFADGNLTWLKEFDDKLSVNYLYYWILSYEGQKKIDAIAKGTAQKAVPIALIRDIELAIPPIETQRRIASILSAYDNLIENNQKQIKLLEEAAQRLYKEWFVDLRFPGHENVKIVDGVPEGWRKESIDDLGEYINGYAFKPSDWYTVGKPIIKIKEMNNGITNDTPRNSGENIPSKYDVTEGDILFSWSATLAVIIWHGEDGLLNQHLFKVVPKENYCREFVFQSISLTIPRFHNLTTGATMKHLQRGKLKDILVVVPNDIVMEKYSRISSIYRNRSLILEKENELLKEARDRLLPKLMSGEIEV